MGISSPSLQTLKTAAIPLPDASVCNKNESEILGNYKIEQTHKH